MLPINIKNEYIRNFFSIKIEVIENTCFPKDRARKLLLNLKKNDVKEICIHVEKLFFEYKFDLFPEPNNNFFSSHQFNINRCLLSLALWFKKNNLIEKIDLFTSWKKEFLDYFYTEYPYLLK